VTLCRCLQSTCVPYAGLAATDYLTIQGAAGGYGQSEKFPVNLTAEMVEMIQEWAATTHYVREVRLFGSRGTAPDSDIDLAITVGGNDSGTILGNWYVEGKRWQPQLTAMLGLKTHLDLYNDPDTDKVRRYCDECSVLLFPLKGTSR
jgi:predicted nucleotidyltransferase